MTGPHARPLVDATDRMVVYSLLFAERVGQPPDAHASAVDLVSAVAERLDEAASSGEETAVYEAAGYVGEWLRAHVPSAVWVSHPAVEARLVVTVPGGSVVYVLPLVGVLRVAMTAGFDGLPRLLAAAVHDAARPPDALPLDAIRVRPDADKDDVVAWVRRQQGPTAALWRRCRVCGNARESHVHLPPDVADLDQLAGESAALLMGEPFDCPCGGEPGEVSRFLLLADAGAAHRFVDVYAAGTHSRIASWTLVHDRVMPLDAQALSLGVV